MSAKATPVRRFTATGDDGRQYTITEFEPPHVEVGDADAEMTIPHRLRTDDGRSVESREDGTYLLLETGATLREDAESGTA